MNFNVATSVVPETDMPYQSIEFNQGYIIEFFGLSGAGKSTLAKALATELVTRGYDVQSFPGKSLFHVNLKTSQQWYRVITGLLRRPVQSGRVLLTLSLAIWFGKRVYGHTRYKLQVWMKWIKRWVLYIDSINELKNTNLINILDRGICTGLHGIITRIDISDIKPIGAALSAAGAFPDLMVIVDADPEMITERRKERGNEQKFWQANRDYEYKKYVQIAELAQSVLQETGGKLIRVISNNQDSIQKNVNRICDEIMNHNKKINDVNKQA